MKEFKRISFSLDFKFSNGSKTFSKCSFISIVLQTSKLKAIQVVLVFIANYLGLAVILAYILQDTSSFERVKIISRVLKIFFIMLCFNILFLFPGENVKYCDRKTRAGNQRQSE